MRKRKQKQKPAADEVAELQVEVTQEDIDEASALGLTGEEMVERVIERALGKKEQH